MSYGERKSKVSTWNMHSFIGYVKEMVCDETYYDGYYVMWVDVGWYRYIVEECGWMWLELDGYWICCRL